MSGRDPVVDEILAVFPLDDYGHVIDCGYDDNDERCGCYDLPSKLQAIVARYVAAALTEAAEEIENRRDACANHGCGGFKGCGGDFCRTYMQGQTEAAALVRARIPT